MITSVVQVVVMVGFPAAAVWGANRNRVLEWLSPVVLCYLFGILAGNLPYVPLDSGVSRTLTEVTVLLAIPLLLFSSNFTEWLRVAPTALLSFVLAVGSVVVMAILSTWIFGHQFADAWKLAGMVIGVYTGGTPNMSAVGLALDVDEEIFVLLNGADLMMGAVYLLFLMTVAQRLLLRFLPAFPEEARTQAPTDGSGMEADPMGALHRQPGRVLLAIVLAAVAVGLSVGGSLLFTGEIKVAAVILGITSFGIAGSLWERVRTIEGTYEVGQYLMLIFCVAIGSMANVADLVAAFSSVFLYLGVALVGAILLHIALAAIFRIDADTVIITSTAAVFGPPFVGPIAGVLKNRDVVVSGLTTGVLGYAVGNYAGLAVAYLLKP